MADRSDFIRQRRSLITICLIFYFIWFKNVEFEVLQILGNIIKVDNHSQTVFQVLWIGFIYWSLRYYQYFLAFGDKGIKRVFWDHMNKFLGNIAVKQFKKSKEFIDNYEDKDKIFVSAQITHGERYRNGYNIKVIVAKKEANRSLLQFEKKERITFYNLIKPRIRSSIYVTINTHLITDYILPIALFVSIFCYGFFWTIMKLNNLVLSSF